MQERKYAILMLWVSFRLFRDAEKKKIRLHGMTQVPWSSSP